MPRYVVRHYYVAEITVEADDDTDAMMKADGESYTVFTDRPAVVDCYYCEALEPEVYHVAD